jgi:hypothetical protein
MSTGEARRQSNNDILLVADKTFVAEVLLLRSLFRASSLYKAIKSREEVSKKYVWKKIRKGLAISLLDLVYLTMPNSCMVEENKRAMEDVRMVIE